MKKTPKTPAFKPYDQHQMFLFPPSIEDMIPKDHPVRVVNSILERINYKSLFDRYPGGGTSSYNPVMLVKVIVYSYLNNIYTSRKIEAALKENIHHMWISGMQQPDHNTINRFRKDKLSLSLKNLFTQVVELLVEQKVISIKELYLDGTKIEANANKYTFVWGNAIKSNKEKMKRQLKDIWEFAQEQASEDEKEDFPFEYCEPDPESVKEAIEKINKSLADSDDEVPAKLKQKLKYAEKNWPVNLKKYQEQEGILGERKSYSKTDKDATFMRMKEDHMMNGQLKAGYNVEIATNSQLVVGYDIFQKPADATTLPDVVKGIQQEYGESPEYLIADAGYGSEENYQFLHKEGIKGVIKYNYYDAKKKRKSKYPFSHENLYYNQEEDCLICPMGQRMDNVGKRHRKTENGYTIELSRYKAKNCEGCPLRGACHKGAGERIIEISHTGRELRQKAEEILESDIGSELYRRRKIDVEPVFGNIKQNMGFTRFTLRGKKGVLTVLGLVAFAHNFRKIILGKMFEFTPIHS